MCDRATHVRDATESDVDGLTVLGVEVQRLHSKGRPDLFRSAEPEALRGFFRSRLSEGSLVLVADHGGSDLDGYVFAEVLERPQSPFKYQHTDVYIHHIAVAQRARRRGVGELLVAETARRAQQAGAATIRLDSWSFNTEAHRFFEAQGFSTARLIFELRGDFVVAGRTRSCQ
ncbi:MULTISPECIES: GNAT family N-acetyltransferase [unclassified Brachybacterium]|uniref:GNAT family N-acetyltransferase n=1 Tax=unclassified Brachybacterium TaxID=2623841 RepID=UPI003619F997